MKKQEILFFIVPCVFYFTVSLIFEYTRKTYSIDSIMLNSLVIITKSGVAIVIIKQIDGSYKVYEWWLSFLLIIAVLLSVIELKLMIGLLILIIIHQIVSLHSQKDVRTRLDLKSEIKLKIELERLVEERTRELQRYNIELKAISLVDSLTGLANRQSFMTRLEELIQRKAEGFAIFYLDLDRFKIINDLHGHTMGDEVLVTLANRLKQFPYNEMEISRLGGDEFAFIFPSDVSSTLIEVSHNIIEMLNEPIVIGSFKFYVSASIGIARYPEDARTAELLLKYADIAMYHCKVNERELEKYAIYSSLFIKKIERNNKIELLLRDADLDKDFRVFYQPQFDAITQKLIGAEALVRWFHSEEGLISPTEFIPISEETEMILKITDWVFEKAMRQIKVWNETYNLDLILGLNLSPKSFNSNDFFENLIRLMENLGIDPKWIEFEITEHSTMTAISMEKMLSVFSEMGVHVSIDDFGTGYSSLSYIKKMDIDTLKIAKELIDDIVHESDIVRAIIMMAHGMGLRTIAEGVETPEQLSILKQLGCHGIQGYLLGRPVPPEEFHWIVNQNKNVYTIGKNENRNVIFS